MLSDKPCHLMLGFDMETDVGSTSREYSGVRQGTSAIIRILEDNGIKATFLFTGDCALQSHDVLELIHQQGFEIGCHSLYHEDMGAPTFNTTSQGMVLEEEIESRLRRIMIIVKEASGKNPVSFRSPRGFASNHLMRVLEKLQFKVDSSYLQSIHFEKNFPYFVSKRDWKHEGEGKLLELPLFAFNLDNAADNKYQKILDQWPRLRTHGAFFVYENMKPVIEEQLKSQDFAALTFYLHPWELCPMPRTRRYAEGILHYDEYLYKGTGDRQRRELETFVKLCLYDGMTFVDFATVHSMYLKYLGRQHIARPKKNVGLTQRNNHGGHGRHSR